MDDVEQARTANPEQPPDRTTCNRCHKAFKSRTKLMKHVFSDLCPVPPLKDPPAATASRTSDRLSSLEHRLAALGLGAPEYFTPHGADHDKILSIVSRLSALERRLATLDGRINNLESQQRRTPRKATGFCGPPPRLQPGYDHLGFPIPPPPTSGSRGDIYPTGHRW